MPISFGLRCTMVVLTCFAMFDFVYVGVLQYLDVSVICVFAFTMVMLFVLSYVLFLLCIFSLICFVCTNVRTAAIE